MSQKKIFLDTFLLSSSLLIYLKICLPTSICGSLRLQEISRGQDQKLRVDWGDQIGWRQSSLPLLASKDDMKQILITTIVAVLLAGTGLAGPIHDAILNENIDEVQLQLDAGTDVNEENAIGYTPLHYAAGVGRIDILELLIEHGLSLIHI